VCVHVYAAAAAAKVKPRLGFDYAGGGGEVAKISDLLPGNRDLLHGIVSNIFCYLYYVKISKGSLSGFFLFK
jgi:hypothetical protein